MTNFDEYPRPMTTFFFGDCGVPVATIQIFNATKAIFRLPFRRVGKMERGRRKERKEAHQTWSARAYDTPRPRSDLISLYQVDGIRTNPIWNRRCRSAQEKKRQEETRKLSSSHSGRKHTTDEPRERAGVTRYLPASTYLYIYNHPTQSQRANTHTLDPFFLPRILVLPRQPRSHR